MIKNNFVLYFSLFFAFFALTGSSCLNSSKTTPVAEVTFNFPNKISCPSSNISFSGEAWIKTEMASASPKLTVKICISCGENLIGDVPVTGKIEDSSEISQARFRREIDFGSTLTKGGNKGCVTKSFRRVPGELAGKKIKATFKDTQGKTESETITIEDRR